MSTADFLSELRALDIRLWIEGDRLRIKAPPGVLSHDLKLQLAERKPEILVLLGQEQAKENPAQALMRLLDELGVQLTLDGEKLKVKASAGVITPELKRQMAEQKEGILALLRTPRAGEALGATTTELNPVQRQQWILQHLVPEALVHNVILALRGTGGLDLEHFSNALALLHRRHQPLRSAFLSHQGRPYKSVVANCLPKFVVMDLREHPKHQLEQELERVLVEEAKRPIKLEEAPLLRTSFVRISDSQFALLFIFHRIIADYWSLQPFVMELIGIYESLKADQSMDHPCLDSRYDELAMERIRFYKSKVYKEKLTWFAKRLEGWPLTFDIPMDRPRGGILSFRGKSRVFSLPEELQFRTTKYAETHQVSARYIFFAVYCSLLHRYLSKDHFLVMMPLPGAKESYKGLLGRFSDSLIFRADLMGMPSFNTVVQNLIQESQEVQAHPEIVPFQLAEELQQDPDMCHNPVCQLKFVYKDPSARTFRIDGISLETIPINFQTALYDLTLRVEKGVNFRLDLEYNADLYEPSTIEKMEAHFLRLLDACLNAPNQPVRELQFLSDEERQTILYHWNQTEAQLPKDVTLHGLFQQQVARTPERIAILVGQQQISYQDLNHYANQLAYYLKECGVREGNYVSLFFNTCLESIISLLAVLKAGAVYVPVHPRLPKSRLAFIIEDTGAALILTMKHLVEQLPEPCPNIIAVDQNWSNITTRPNENHPINIVPTHPAYVIYTPMSTRRPKAVVANHLAVSNRLLWFQQNYALGEDDIVLQRTPLTSGTSVNEVIWPLIAGSRFIIPSELLPYNYAALIRLIIAERITILHLVPYGLEQILREPQVSECVSLKRIFCGAEPLAGFLVGDYLNKLPKTELINLFGATEAGGDVTAWHCRAAGHTPIAPIGRPIANTKIYILDSCRNPLPPGVPGDLYVSGIGLAKGYLNRQAMTRERFLPNPFARGEDDQFLFQTGDRARYLADGNIEYLGRVDSQVKVHGLRVNLAEIEAAVMTHEAIAECAAVFRRDAFGEPRLVAYYVSKGDTPLLMSSLTQLLALSLPEEIIPTTIIRTESLPRTSLGKIDRDQLPIPEEFIKQRSAFPRAYSEVERAIARVWREVLGEDFVGVEDNFFALGGESLQLLEVYHRLPDMFKHNLIPAHLFQYPTIHELGLFLERETEEAIFTSPRKDNQDKLVELAHEWASGPGLNLAIIGFAGRFPGAEHVGEFWSNLLEGVTSVTHFSKEQLSDEGVSDELLDDPYYVPARAILTDVRQFDAAFFNLTSREAAITDPQQRLFFECAFHALESAGYGLRDQKTRVGLFAGSGEGLYYHQNLAGNPRVSEVTDGIAIQTGNRLDHLCTRTAYLLGLKGPAVNIQAGNLTALMAVTQAACALHSGECQVALAGGVYLDNLQRAGYLRHADRTLSLDGICRPFDQQASGQVPGQGVALVVLKKIKNAILDGDVIHAVIRGMEIEPGNNDQKYGAPNLETWAGVIQRAHEKAGVSAASISYIEVEGSGEPEQDAVELGALERIYQDSGLAPRSCALGGLKANIGSLEHASFAAALIKVCLALKAGMLPAQLHLGQMLERPNHATSPLYFNQAPLEWNQPSPRRAGINAFDRCGYHGHLVLEEAPQLPVAAKTRPWQVLTLSAKSPEALETLSLNLVSFLKQNPQLDFTDVCFTLNSGREAWKHRRMVVVPNLHEAVLELEQHNPERVFSRSAHTCAHPITFMFPGQGVQYQNMGRQLYQVEPSYRKIVDRCWSIVGQNAPELYDNLTQHDRGSRSEKLHQTYVTQPATFITEYALATLLIQWGIKPSFMIGNSLGEYVAATLAGVFSLEDALEMVCTRGRLMQLVPEGRQLAVGLSEEEVMLLLNDELSLAGMAGPQQAMVAGSTEAIDVLKRDLDARGIFCFRLFSSHAFHSYMMDPIIKPFREAVARVQLHPPKIPFISTITGTWITDEEAVDPDYWARQLRLPVRFSQGLEAIFAKGSEQFLLEVGPDKQLTTIALRHPAKSKRHVVLATMRQPLEEESDCHHLLNTLGRLWLNGFPVDWHGFHSERRNRKLVLPSYPFERKDYWMSRPGAWEEVEEGHHRDEDPLLPMDEEDYRAVPTDLVAPRDTLESEICGYWQQTLGLTELGIYDDFFELGGNSLIGVRLVNLLRRRLRIPLANPILLQKRNVASLSDYIKEIRALAAGEGNQNSIIVQLQRGERGSTPLFLFHPIEGDILIYRQLIDFLDAKQLVFAIQAKSLLGGEAFADIPAQAAAYLEDIRKIQPRGPYMLAGFSYGGFLAYEVSRMLMEAGEKVSLTSMIDSSHPSTVNMTMSNPVEILAFLIGYGVEFPEAEYKGLSDEEQIAYAESRIRAANRASLIPPVFGLEMCRTWLGHQAALNAYRPKPFPGRVLFFNATELMGDAKAGGYYPWLDLVQGGLELHHVPGHHISIMNVAEKVKIIAKHFKRALNTA